MCFSFRKYLLGSFASVCPPPDTTQEIRTLVCGFIIVLAVIVRLHRFNNNFAFGTVGADGTCSAGEGGIDGVVDSAGIACGANGAGGADTVGDVNIGLWSQKQGYRPC